MTVTDAATRSQAYLDDRAHVFHSWSAQQLLDPVVITGAEGASFWDDQGRRYLDFASQLVNMNIGHQHPKLVAAIKEQADKLCTVAPIFANDARSEAARLIAELAPGDLDMVFFTNGGAEATENAVRMARGHTGRFKVLTTYRSYHGATSGAITMTGDPRRWPSEPGMPGVVKFWGPYPYRSAFHASSEEEECARALQHLADVIMVEGGHTVAAVVLESVVGTNGILVPPDGYLQGVRDLCDEHGIVMIADEVMAGFGRCGEWFAIDHWDVTPDLICFAKGVNSGYVPLGGVVISRAIADTFAQRPYPGGLTYSGHPLACASAVASINIFKEEGVHRARPPPRHRHHRTGADRDRRPPPERRRRARPRRVLGRRAGEGPGDAGAAGAVQRRRSGGGADERVRRRLQAARPVAVHALQPDPRRAADHDRRRRPPRRPGDHRRGPRGRRPPHHVRITAFVHEPALRASFVNAMTRRRCCDRCCDGSGRVCRPAGGTSSPPARPSGPCWTTTSGSGSASSPTSSCGRSTGRPPTASR